MGAAHDPWQQGSRTGILNNKLYIGRLVWNRLRYVKDPETGKRLSRLNPPDQWIVQDVPHLRIIDDDLWQKGKARQDATALGKHNKSKAEGFWDRRRARFLLSGLIECGYCGSTFVKISQQHFGCASARNKAPVRTSGQSAAMSSKFLCSMAFSII